MDEIGSNREAQDRLISEAGELRRRLFPWASDEAWRRERLYRYLYWRKHREHPPFNLVGSWDRPDLEREISRWQDYERRHLTEEEVFQLLANELEHRYGRSWSEALEEGTSPLLGEVGVQ